jgi:hypothetical protein
VRIVLPLLLFIAQLVPAPASGGGPTAEAPPFVLGVVRRDGIVIPFSSFDGKRWDTPWPADLRYLELPISIGAIPGRWWGKAGAPAEMSVWIGGSRRGPVRLERPTMLRSTCGARLALTSSYHSDRAAPPPMVQPYPKDGLAISGGQPIEAIDTLPRTATEWIPTAVNLVEPFDHAELAAINAFGGWKHPIARKERQKVPVELEMLYRAPMDADGWTAYYVEAIKRYPPGKDDGDCGLITYGKGWITSGPDAKAAFLITARVTYCDRRDATFLLPLGLINAQGKTYWVYQLSGYGGEGYFVTRPTPRSIEPHVYYDAGFCGL